MQFHLPECKAPGVLEIATEGGSEDVMKDIQKMADDRVHEKETDWDGGHNIGANRRTA